MRNSKQARNLFYPVPAARHIDEYKVECVVHCPVLMFNARLPLNRQSHITAAGREHRAYASAQAVRVNKRSKVIHLELNPQRGC